jgi:hypothetical protein
LPRPKARRPIHIHQRDTGLLWIISAISVFAAWGAAALIVGILFFGVGPFLLAPVVYLVHADWENLGAYFIFMALLWAA